ncbi:MAG: ring-cleaving dioxygenase [Anaerolineales bacterium]|nr:ring-cleaving dioxygenase [Anaerolineales bacterium]
MTTAQGIHHITAIGSDPQRLVDFYTQTLGLRLVKKTVNQDDVSAYHLFFGDQTGGPGMDLTFFTFPRVATGNRGAGQVTTTSLAVPAASLSFWQARFETLGVTQEPLVDQFGWERLVFYDPDNQQLELVGVDDLPADTSQVWTTSQIGVEQAIRHFHSARMLVNDKSLIEPILIQSFGYEQMAEEGDLNLYVQPGVQRSAYLELQVDPDAGPGRNASGTVHHIAFTAEDDSAQNELREQVRRLGLQPTEVIDRYYFKSVYFRTPAGVLFEIATSGPGFTADEDAATLGERLALPPFLEPHREQIEAGLTPVTVKQ